MGNQVAADGAPEVFAPHIETIVDSIGKLTILEVTQLNSLMKKRFNLSDVSMVAPVEPTEAPKVEVEEVEEAPAVIQTAFDVKLVEFNPKDKVKTIKTVKQNVEGLNLVQAKGIVEKAPIVLASGLDKEAADKLAQVFIDIGCKMTVE